MIQEADFIQINSEVTSAINAVFDSIASSSQGNYVLFLADGEFVPKYLQAVPPSEANVIDSRVDGYDDQSRIEFLVWFLQEYYTFPKQTVQASTDQNIRLQLELMIYSHVWEAKPFLKRLARLATLIDGSGYQWDVQVPSMGKHDYIRNEIRQKFDSNGFQLANVIRNGFHTSLRNAFAHSDYTVDSDNNRIWLRNYGGAPWELQEISFDDWARRFAYTILLAYRVSEISAHRRSSLIQVFGTDTFIIDYPLNNGTVKQVPIRFRAQYNAFNFV